MCLQPKKLYKLYKFYNAKQTNLKKHRKFFINKIFNILNYKYLLIQRKYLNF